MFFCQIHDGYIAPENCGIFIMCPQDCGQRSDMIQAKISRSPDPCMVQLQKIQALVKQRIRINNEIQQCIDRLKSLESTDHA